MPALRTALGARLADLRKESASRKGEEAGEPGAGEREEIVDDLDLETDGVREALWVALGLGLTS